MLLLLASIGITGSAAAALMRDTPSGADLVPAGGLVTSNVECHTSAHICIHTSFTSNSVKAAAGAIADDSLFEGNLSLTAGLWPAMRTRTLLCLPALAVYGV